MSRRRSSPGRRVCLADHDVLGVAAVLKDTRQTVVVEDEDVEGHHPPDVVQLLLARLAQPARLRGQRGRERVRVADQALPSCGSSLRSAYAKDPLAEGVRALRIKEAADGEALEAAAAHEVHHEYGGHATEHLGDRRRRTLPGR